jgi:tetratricopeptide (TPR) repeat protein
VLIQYAIRKDQERPEFHALHAQALDRVGGNSRDLVKALETAVRLNRKDIDSTIRLAEVYQSLGMQTRATRLWEAAFNLNPNHPIFRKQAREAKKSAQLKNALSDSGQDLKGQWIELVEKIKKMLGR